MNKPEGAGALRLEVGEDAPGASSDAGSYRRYGCGCEWGAGAVDAQGSKYDGLSAEIVAYLMFWGFRQTMGRQDPATLLFAMDNTDGLTEHGKACAADLGRPDGSRMVGANLQDMARSRGAKNIVVGMKSVTDELHLSLWSNGVRWGMRLQAGDVWKEMDPETDFEKFVSMLSKEVPPVIPDVFSTRATS